MKIAIVSQYFPPEPVRIPEAVARELAARGHTVRVITGFPNYPEGRLYAGYRQQLGHRERRDSYTVHRVPLVTSHTASPFGRAASYASFAATSLTARSVLQGADVTYVYATQMTAAVGPDVWQRLGGAPFVLHVQDLWPESITDSSLVGSPRVARAIDRLLNPWLEGVYRRASAVVAIAPTMKDLLIDRGVARSKITTVLNWASNEEALLALPEAQPRADGRITVTYAGNTGDLQGLDAAITAAARLAADTPAFRLVIVGTGVAEERLRRLGSGTRNVEFRGRVALDRMPDVYRESDFQLVSLRDLAVLRGTIPSKLQGSFAAGVPVVAAVPGDVSRLVAGAEAGFVARPDDVESLEGAFRAAAKTTIGERRAMGARARGTYVGTMSLSHGVEQIESVLAGCARGAGSRV